MEPVDANEAAEENRLLARPDDPVLVDETEMRGRCPCCWNGCCLLQYMADDATQRLAYAQQSAADDVRHGF